MTSRKRPAVLCRPLDFTLFAVLVLLWLVPVTYSGITFRSVKVLPDYLRYLCRASCLFQASVTQWNDFYVQVRPAGSDVWLTPPEREFSTMKPAGNRTRLGWAVSGSRADPSGEIQRQAIAEFVKKRYEELHPERGSVGGVRFLMITYETGEDALANPVGGWEQPPLETVPPGRGLLLSTHSFDRP